MDLVNANKSIVAGLTGKTSATVANNDLIQLYANDGTPNGKISRTDFMDMVKASLPGILSDQGTSGTSFPSIASGVLGSMSAANLASVLGVLKVDVATLNTTDFNTVKDSGNYKAYFASQSAADAYHCPAYGALSIVVFNQRSFVTQLVYGSNGAYARNGSIIGDSVSWASWSRLDNFGCNTPAELASLLGEEMVYKNAGYYSADETIELGGYGLYILTDCANTGGTTLFTFSYQANSVNIISDPLGNISSGHYSITKSSAGTSCVVTNNNTIKRTTIIKIGGSR